MIQTICRNCGRSDESEETAYYVVNLPSSDARKTVESRLMDYYESDVENHITEYARFIFCHKNIGHLI